MHQTTRDAVKRHFLSGGILTIFVKAPLRDCRLTELYAYFRNFQKSTALPASEISICSQFPCIHYLVWWVRVMPAHAMVMVSKIKLLESGYPVGLLGGRFVVMPWCDYTVGLGLRLSVRLGL